MLYDLQSMEDPRDMVHRCVQTLVEGGLVGMPSETVYGLIASARDVNAVQRLDRILRQAWPRQPASSSKIAVDRTIQGSLALSLRSGESAGDFLMHTGRGRGYSLARRLCERCFAGPLTLVADASDPASAMSHLPIEVQEILMAGDSRDAAFRVSDHRLLSHVHRYLAAPLVWGEMPDEGGKPITTAEGLQSRLREIGSGDNESDEVDSASGLPLILDDGVSRYGGWGTTVRVNERTWTVLRDGVIQRAAMNQFVKPVIAVVCTGNTCRSPMAETLLKDILQRRFGREDAARVVSAGVAAGRGGGASPQAVEVMGQQGLDLTGHASRPLDDELVSMADLVLTMTRRHRDAILAAWPNRADRVFTLRRDGGDITDPVGMPVDVYQACANQLRDELTKWVDELGPDFFPVELPEHGGDRHNDGPVANGDPPRPAPGDSI
ncbi:MAG: protein tyrosine phosphatase [Planctomycetota bacterium]